MNSISLIHQEGALRSFFPDSRIHRKGEREIIWIHTLQPSPLSDIYQVKLHYLRGKGIAVYVMFPTLKLAPGKNRLPHVYDMKTQKLCLFYPQNREWHTGLFYVKTIIPWISEWLYFYEIWVGSGEWLGGGIEHASQKDNEPL